MATNYGFAGPRIVSDGLVLYLDAANPNSYNPSTPLIWRDISRNGNNGTLVNGVEYSSANGGSLVFDGSNDFIKINNNQVANNLPSMTVSVWVNAAWVNQTSNYQPIITKISDASAGAGWDMGYVGDNTPRSFYFYTQNAGGSIYKFFKTDSLNLVNNTWINVTASYTNNFANILIYINGTSQSLINQSTAGTLTSISTTSSVTIATRDGINTLGTNFASLRLSNACIYNRVLSQSEITQNFNATRGRFGI
jgi:hypothetical protein